MRHAQFGVVQQGLGQCTEVVRGPDQLRVVVHHGGQGQVAHAAQQFGGLVAGVLAGDACADLEQGLFVLFALVEAGFAGGGLVVVGHWFLSLNL